MTRQMNIGDTGKTLGPLNPTGRICIDGLTMDACSEGVWVESNAEVVIVGGNTRRAIVRETPLSADRLQNDGAPLPEEVEIQETPLQYPLTWIEQCNTVAIGLGIGIALVPIFWLSGHPMNTFALAVPMSSAIAGWVFRFFLGAANESVGPREDHRPRVMAMALFIGLCCIAGSAIGLNMGWGFLGLSCGISLGALIGGILAYLGLILLFFF